MSAFLKILLKVILIVTSVLVVSVVVLNMIVCFSTSGKMRSVEDSFDDNGYDCIIVLGCGIRGDEPTPLLSDRLDAAVALYNAGAAPKMLMSGDHGRDDHDEVSVMRKYVMEKGVPSEDIFLDHAGFSTYETMYRASYIFGIKRAVVVTQKYHLYRALYDASAFKIEAVGTIATGHVFKDQLKWDIREVFARVKDFFYCIFKPDPTYKGEKIDITGSGEVTLD